MAKDFLQKEPTKNEKMFYEIAMHLNDLDHRTWSVSSHVLAMGILLGVDPQKMAEILTGDDSKIKEYANKINEAIEKIQKEKDAKQSKPAADAGGHAEHNHTGHDHDHGHDHSGHSH